MTILAFWSIFDREVGRHAFDDVSDRDAFDILWHKRDEMDVLFYYVELSGYNPLSKYNIMSAAEFEKDFNDEKLDEGGRWTRVLNVDWDDVRKIINE
jgi:hypothetical protein